MIDLERVAFTESLHPRAAGKFAKKSSAAPAKKSTAGARSSGTDKTGKGSLSFDGRRGAGYGTPGGDKRVHALQQALNRLGFADGLGKSLKDDGKLGPKTTAAIKRAQRAMGLKADGVVTPALLAKLSGAKKAADLKKAPAKKAAAAKKAPAFVKPAKTVAKKAPTVVHRSAIVDVMSNVERHLPGRHNQGAHGNRFKIPGDHKSGFSHHGKESRATHEKRKGTHDVRPADEVEVVDNEAFGIPRGQAGKVGRHGGFVDDTNQSVNVEFPDGSQKVYDKRNLKVKRTHVELDDEDRKADDARIAKLAAETKERRARAAQEAAKPRTLSAKESEAVLKDGHTGVLVPPRAASEHKALLVKAGATPEHADEILKDLGVKDPDSHYSVDIGSTVLHTRQKEETDSRNAAQSAALKKATPAAYDHLLGNNGHAPLAKSKPVRTVFEAMQSSGWTITSATGHGGYTFSSADGKRHINVSTVNGVTLYDSRHNKISGVKALALVKDPEDKKG